MVLKSWNCFVGFVFVTSVSITSSIYIRTKDETPPCGILNSRQPRIFGGRDAKSGEVPWIVSIQKNNEHACGGSIISERFILSAAHCFEDESLSGAMSSSLEHITIVLGSRNINRENSQAKIHHIKRIITHSDYNTNSHYNNDIALIELSKEIEWTPRITPICLPPGEIQRNSDNDPNQNSDPVPAIASGWGRTWGKQVIGYAANNIDNVDNEVDTGMYSPHAAILQTVNLAIYSNSFCDSIYSQFTTEIRLLETQLCAGSANDGGRYQDLTTKGDSGGPLAILVNGRWTIAGVTSLEPWFTGPGIYSRVSKYLSWLHDNTQLSLV